MVSEGVLNVRYSHCSNRCWVPVRSVSFGRLVNVSSNKVSVVVVFVKNTFKVSVSSHKLSGVSQTSCVSHQQQFFSELHSPGRSHYTKNIQLVHKVSNMQPFILFETAL